MMEKVLNLISQELGVELVGDAELNRRLLSTKIREMGMSEAEFDQLLQAAAE